MVRIKSDTTACLSLLLLTKSLHIDLFGLVRYIHLKMNENLKKN